MQKLKKFRWRLPLVDVAWLHFKWALAAMLVVPMFNSATMKQNTTVVFLIVWIAVCVGGAVMSTVGLFLTAQHGELRRRGFKLEMTGLILMLAGPVVFMLVQLGLLVEDGSMNRMLGVAFPYVVCAAVVARMTMIVTAANRGTVIVRYVDPDRPSGEQEADTDGVGEAGR